MSNILFYSTDYLNNHQQVFWHLHLSLCASIIYCVCPETHVSNRFLTFSVPAAGTQICSRPLRNTVFPCRFFLTILTYFISAREKKPEFRIILDPILVWTDHISGRISCLRFWVGSCETSINPAVDIKHDWSDRKQKAGEGGKKTCCTACY